VEEALSKFGVFGLDDIEAVLGCGIVMYDEDVRR